MRELISAADDKCVEGVAGIELRRAIPIESRLRTGCYRRRSRNGGGKSAIVTHGSCRRIIVGGDELHLTKIHVEIVERLLNQVGIFIAHVPKFRRGNANVHDSVVRMTVASGFEPGVV